MFPLSSVSGQLAFYKYIYMYVHIQYCIHTFILAKNRGHVNLAHVHQDARAHSDPVKRRDLGLNKIMVMVYQRTYQRTQGFQEVNDVLSCIFSIVHPE